MIEMNEILAYCIYFLYYKFSLLALATLNGSREPQFGNQTDLRIWACIKITLSNNNNRLKLMETWALQSHPLNSQTTSNWLNLLFPNLSQQHIHKATTHRTFRLESDNRKQRHPKICFFNIESYKTVFFLFPLFSKRADEEVRQDTLTEIFTRLQH